MQAFDETTSADTTAGETAGRPSHLSEVAFADLPLHPSLRAALDRLGFTHCTPIQARTLPLALAGRDVAGQAQTGTGKSAAFLLATLQTLLTHERRGGKDAPRALILAPTRELAIQIERDAQALATDSGLTVAVIYGGTGYDSQRQQLLDGIDILIATPGRLIDFFKQKLFTLKHIEVVVLDEADRMFDLGFIADIRFLLRRCSLPQQRRNYLFSATLSHRVLELAYEHMNDPMRIEVAPEQVTAERVRQALIHVANEDKLPVLIGLLRAHDPLRTLVFVNTKRAAESVESALNLNGFSAATLSGDVPQKKRERLLDDFKSGSLPILVATDVAARGLHIPDVSHVINFDLPQDAEDYVHRIGRTARAGESGDAISLCCETYVYSLPDIEGMIGNRIPVEPDTGRYRVSDFHAPPRPARRGPPDGRRGGRSGSGGGRSGPPRRR
jgi:Superfamily II DNA and RNA helicases